MSIRVWQSHPRDTSGWSDWEMECVAHDEHVTSPDWLWAMEAAWGHIAMHHGQAAR